jgi:antitoxin MazE
VRQGTELELTVAGGKLVAVPVRKGARTLEQLLAGITDENIHAEVDFGPPVGREIW